MIDYDKFQKSLKHLETQNEHYKTMDENLPEWLKEAVPKSINNILDIEPEDQKILLELLNQYLPTTEVWLYGSRIKGTARPYSDLDMVVFTQNNQQMFVFDLKEAFEDSDLPFRVDLFTWDDVPESFHKNIKAEHIIFKIGE